MLARALDHVAVTVRDLDRSLAFYQGQLGLEEVARHRLEGEPISTMAGIKGVVMQVVRLISRGTPRIQIDLQQYLAPEGRVADSALGDIRNSHIGFQVDDMDDAYQRLSANGVEFVSAPVTFDLGDEGTIRVVFLKDPDGFILELTETKAKAD
jgi:catechol 2,3-dioxygenase-like lactoylglutathione lyase family enzyme